MAIIAELAAFTAGGHPAAIYAEFLRTLRRAEPWLRPKKRLAPRPDHERPLFSSSKKYHRAEHTPSRNPTPVHRLATRIGIGFGKTFVSQPTQIFPVQLETIIVVPGAAKRPRPERPYTTTGDGVWPFFLVPSLPPREVDCVKGPVEKV